MFSADGTWFAHPARLDVFINSPAALSIAVEAQRLGFEDVRITAVLPNMVLVVNGDDRPELAALAALATTAAGTVVKVRPLEAYPAWRCSAAWRASTRFCGAARDDA